MSEKSTVKFIILFGVVILVQMTFVPYCTIGGVIPDLCNSLFIAAVMLYQGINMLAFALCIGLVKDLFTNHYFGFETFSLLVPTGILMLIIKKCNLKHSMIRHIIFFLFSFLSFLTLKICLMISEKQSILVETFFGSLFSITIYTTVISIIMYYVLALFAPPVRRFKQYELF
jgi:hypothetical protein